MFRVICIFVLMIGTLSSAQAANFYGVARSMDGFSAQNEENWQRGLRELASGHIAEAFQAWQAAATPEREPSKGHNLSQLALSIFYREGIFVDQDDEQADRYWELGIEQRIGTSSSYDEVRNIHIGQLYVLLGENYASATGVSRDIGRAFRYFLMAAEYGSSHGRYRVGNLLEEGSESRRADPQGAFGYYKGAASDGYAPAQYSIAELYLDGRGVPQNFLRGYMWLSLAAANEGPNDQWDVRERLLELATSMSPAQISSAQELAHECYSSDYVNCGW